LSSILFSSDPSFRVLSDELLMEGGICPGILLSGCNCDEDMLSKRGLWSTRFSEPLYPTWVTPLKCKSRAAESPASVPASETSKFDEQEEVSARNDVRVVAA
jgi:hypothetical protein